MIILVLVSAFFGAGAVMATDAVQESRQQEVLLTRIQGEQQIAALQFEMVLENLEEVRRQVENGMVPREALLDAELTLHEAETHIERLGIDEEEIRASGREPRNELSAPLVDGRDFVADRLALEGRMVRMYFHGIQERFLRVRSLADEGMVGEGQVAEARMAMEEATQQIHTLEARQALRARFRSGKLTGPELDRQVEVMEVENHLEQMKVSHAHAQRQFQEIQDAVQQGQVPDRELSMARLQLMQIELELDTARRTLEILKGERM